jgi:hypothetical protein
MGLFIGILIVALYGLGCLALVGDGKCDYCGSAHGRDPRGCEPYLPPEKGFPRKSTWFPGWFKK